MLFPPCTSLRLLGKEHRVGEGVRLSLVASCSREQQQCLLSRPVWVLCPQFWQQPQLGLVSPRYSLPCCARRSISNGIAIKTPWGEHKCSCFETHCLYSQPVQLVRACVQLRRGHNRSVCRMYLCSVWCFCLILCLRHQTQQSLKILL